MQLLLLAIGQRLPALGEQPLDRFLRGVDARALLALVLGSEPAEALQALGDRPGLAEEAGLFVFQRGRLRHRGESGAGFGHQLLEI